VAQLDWKLVGRGRLRKVYKLSTISSHGNSYVVIFPKNEFGYILGDFFKNASGHPDGKRWSSEGKRSNLSYQM
jgi:hypothetical protein